MAHTHKHSVPRDAKEGLSLGNGSDAHLTHISVTNPLIKLMGYEHREDALVGGGASNGKHTQTHTHAHTSVPVIHRVDGASGTDRKQS